MVKQVRAVVGARVSVLKGEEKVSHHAQREAGDRWADARDWSVIGYFEDLDVSATVSPFDRPDLGPWLTEERTHEWDAMIWSKIDRAFRDPRDSVNVAYWFEKRQKVMVFTDDGLTLDFRPDADPTARMMAEMFLLMGSMFGKWELRRFQSRGKDIRTATRLTDRWVSSSPPEGYRVIDHPSGKGRKLEPDPERQRLLRRIAAEAIEGNSIEGITQRLNADGVLTRQDYLRSPEDREGKLWNSTQVHRVLRSPATQGWKMSGDRQVLDTGGNPIKMAGPTFDDSTWRQLQEALSDREIGKAKQVNRTSPLLHVAYCGVCHSPSKRVEFRRGGKVYSYYYCNNKRYKCGSKSMPSADAQELVEQEFLARRGNDRVTKRVFVPGEDNTEELERVRKTITSLRDDRDMGLIVGESDEAEYRQRMKALIERRTELEALPQRAAGWVEEETDQTYTEAWHGADEQAKRKMLVDADVKLFITAKNDFEILVPPKHA